MKQTILVLTVLLLMAGCIPQDLPGPEGRPGKDGAIGPQGEKGAQGIAGMSFPKDQLQKLETFLSQEYVVGIESYSFGLAPRIAGFCFLTSHGRIFKLENKNTQVLGESIAFVSQIANNTNFVALSRTAYGDDIKQYFSAVTQSGDIFTSENLKTWTSPGTLSLE